MELKFERIVLVFTVVGALYDLRTLSQSNFECFGTVDIEQLPFQHSNISGRPEKKLCSWPRPPSHGFNYHSCNLGNEETYCRDEEGALRPHGSSKITGCKKNHLLSHGEECTVCNNGEWTYSNFQCVECGRTQFEDVALIHFGHLTAHGDFPWMAALYLFNEEIGKWEQSCGGTLISNHLVLTAAHCVKFKNSDTVKPADLKVGLGKLYRDFYHNETTAVLANVREIVLPRRYVGFAHGYDLDIALIDLEDLVPISDHVMPACVDWKGKMPLTHQETGYLAGFGLTEMKTASEKLKWARQQYIEYENCLTMIRPGDLKLVTQDKFCITSLRGQQADYGDSGGGLIFFKNGAYYVYGVVSTKLEEGGVNVVLFTNLMDEKHRNWILAHWRRLRKEHHLSLDELIKDIFTPKNTTENENAAGKNETTRFCECGTGTCKCVPYYRCESPEESETGNAVIDIRPNGENSCNGYLDVCCPIYKIVEEFKNQTNVSVAPKDACGIRNKGGVGFTITGDTGGESEYGEFPWMMAVLRSETVEQDDNETQTLNVYQCGGSLIHPQVVLTAAHCVHNKRNLTIRAGEWDTQTKDEIYPNQDRAVVDVIVHEQFNRDNLVNDVALLELNEPVNLDADNVGLVCLPELGEIMDGRNCVASGWGKDSFGKEGKYQVILKKVEMPVVPKAQCQVALQTALQRPRFTLHNSFLCAGGRGKDTCKGDGGSPLVCPSKRNPDVYVQAGVVAWGVECGSDTPGVYVNIPHFVDWINDKLDIIAESLLAPRR